MSSRDPAAKKNKTKTLEADLQKYIDEMQQVLLLIEEASGKGKNSRALEPSEKNELDTKMYRIHLRIEGLHGLHASNSGQWLMSQELRRQIREIENRKRALESKGIPEAEIPRHKYGQ